MSDYTAKMSMSVDPGIFSNPPQQPITPKNGQLTEEQIDQFFKQGYVIVPDLFTDEELQPSIDELKEYTDEVIQQAYNQGHLKSLYKEHGLWTRLTEARKEYPDIIVKMYKHGKLPKNVHLLWGHEKLLNIMEQLIGSEVGGHPVMNIRFNTPALNDNSVSYSPWHQDSAYFGPESRKHMIVTAWVPFQDTGGKNGGLQVIPRSHLSGKVATHEACYKDSQLLFLREETFEKELGLNVKDAIKCDVPKGGVLLFSNVFVHRSLPNKSDEIRWSVDFRYQSHSIPWSYFGICDGIRFRSKGEDIHENLEKFMNINRPALWEKLFLKKDFDRSMMDQVIAGPWMAEWEHTHPNKHSKAFAMNRREN